MHRESRDLRNRPTPPDRIGQPVQFNHASHRRSHMGEIRILTYTSKASLDTNAGTPIYPHVPGRLLSVRGNVSGAPSSTLTIDVLFDGSSVYTVSSKPTIASSVLYGDPAAPDVKAFTTTTKIQVQLTDTGSATGPIVVQLKCFIPYDTEMLQ